uniref:DUF721 domain-containing protein n=1 Tax=candidate division WOR-3 bacterium TaxID=2052148 RepID=A0A7C2K4K5_UNCW3
MKNLDDSIKKILENLGIERSVGLAEKAKKLREYLIETYGEESVGKVKVIKGKIYVEIKSSVLRNELFMRRAELLTLINGGELQNNPENIVIVGRL